MRDPGDFGIYSRMRTATFGELVDAGSVICGSPATVREQLIELRPRPTASATCTRCSSSAPCRTRWPRTTSSLFAAEVLPHLKSVWNDEGYAHHWWPERLGGQPHANPAFPAEQIGA